MMSQPATVYEYWAAILDAEAALRKLNEVEAKLKGDEDASSCVLTSVVKEPSGRVLVNFASGQQLEFNNMAQLTEAIDAVDSNETQTELMCIGYAKARSGDLSHAREREG